MNPSSCVRWLVGGTLLFACVAPGKVANAQNAAPMLREVQRGLARYDLRGSKTTRAVVRLRRFLSQNIHSADRREARFLLSVLSADLLVLAKLNDDPQLHARALKAWGGSLGDLDKELRAISRGVYASVARDARHALRVVQGGDPSWYQISGPRRDVLFLLRVQNALGEQTDASASSRVRIMARFGRDPCASSDRCSEPYARFDKTGRRAVNALADLGRVIRRLQSDPHGDPFMMAIQGAVAAVKVEDSSTFARNLVLAPALKPIRSLALTRAPASTTTGSIDAVVAVGIEEIAWGFLPRVGLSASGEPVVLERRGPVLPKTAIIRVSQELRPVPQALPELTELFAEVIGTEAAVAIGAKPKTPAHMFTRAMLSARRAGVNVRTLVAKTDVGALSFRAFDVDDSERGQGVQVYVRLGGFSVRTPGGTQTVPRVRDGSQWRFDWDELSRVTPARRKVSIRYMSGAGLEVVLGAAFKLAHERHPLVLALR